MWVTIISKEVCSESCIARGRVATFGSHSAASVFKRREQENRLNPQPMSSIL